MNSDHDMQSADYAEFVKSIQSNEGWNRILESFARFVNPSAGARVADLGTGAGTLVNLLRTEYQADAFGIDYNSLLLKVGRELYPDQASVQGTAYRLPLADKSLDMLTATNVLYLLETPQQALVEIQRVLKLGGIIVLLNPSDKMNMATATQLADERGLTGASRDQLINWGRVAEEHPRWSVAEIETMLKDVGCAEIETRERVGNGLALYVRAIRKQ